MIRVLEKPREARQGDVMSDIETLTAKAVEEIAADLRRKKPKWADEPEQCREFAALGLDGQIKLTATSMGSRFAEALRSQQIAAFQSYGVSKETATALVEAISKNAAPVIRRGLPGPAKF